ncbi:uncharacterized protein LOC107399083 [Tribolium castaneum]|uniref:Uncharacterized protein n=1 Tax=Tribolium castaneum TaxID=7070 RepID=D6W706_TRICA|nr:PREDICTED: uncharacterized protein LOC107399083 [Tribolium castaneum]EFA11432.1 hypothetical protein TcasGA2_TC013610 [Tribolium castaneum]|eukprot:XP_015840263.1 PREDICTED: uncharacterized protein LOC107399083 [Tribolium castaneum]
MGSFCSKVFEDDKREAKIIRVRLLVLLDELGPVQLLNVAVRDRKIYDVCKNDGELRQACIWAAVRRHHRERFVYEDVHNRTADYVLLMDDFIKVQDAEDEQRYLEEETSDQECIIRRRNRLAWERNLRRAIRF